LRSPKILDANGISPLSLLPEKIKRLPLLRKVVGSR
jgi:hypothetical protein